MEARDTYYYSSTITIVCNKGLLAKLVLIVFVVQILIINWSEKWKTKKWKNEIMTNFQKYIWCYPSPDQLDGEQEESENLFLVNIYYWMLMLSHQHTLTWRGRSSVAWVYHEEKYLVGYWLAHPQTSGFQWLNLLEWQHWSKPNNSYQVVTALFSNHGDFIKR